MDQSIKPRTPLQAVRAIGEGLVVVDATERRRIMLMAVGEAYTGNGACERCSYCRSFTQRVGVDEYNATESLTECDLGSEDPMECLAVREAFEAGQDERVEVAV